MSKRKIEPIAAAEVQPTWEYLQKQERILQRNTKIYRIIRHIGMEIFVFNLLLVSMNLILFLFEDRIGTYFEALPLLPSLVRSMPRGGWGGVIVFSVCLAYIVPLAISGGVAGIFYYLDRKNSKEIPSLIGTSEQQAKALLNQAETVYELRKKIKSRSIYPATSVLTAATAAILVLMFIDYATAGAMALELSLVLLALLVCVFILFWAYALLVYLFKLLQSLYYLSENEWKLYELYHRIRAYWQTINPKQNSDAQE